MSSNNDALLRAILTLIARQTFPPERLAEIVIAKGAGAKQVKAFNLCDGSKTQGEIAKSLKLDAGNFSRTVSRWLEEGVVFRLGGGRDATLLHVYRLPDGVTKKKGSAK